MRLSSDPANRLGRSPFNGSGITTPTLRSTVAVPAVAELGRSPVKSNTHTFTSSLERIVDFLYQPENINHKDVVYMNFSPDTCIFEDKSSGSDIYLEFSDPRGEKISKIQFCLEGESGIVHRWVRKFQDDFGATVDELG